jgi:histidinol-phosphatase
MDLRDMALDVARRAGAVALEGFRRGFAVESKADGSPVTAADRAAEVAAREMIELHCPEDGILGEELGEVRAGARRRWIVDPIDGTRSFVRGVPLWGTLVAVMEGDEVLAGAAVFPAAGEWIAAERGRGAVWSGGSPRVSGVSRLAEAAVLSTDDRLPEAPAERSERWRRLVAGANVDRTWGDAYGYMLVATGRAEVMVDGVLAPWDAAAVLPIVEEAGGVFTDWTGRRTPFGGSAIATNAALSAEVRRILVEGR